MCSAFDDPTTYDSPVLTVTVRPTCEYPLWLAGTRRACGQSVGVQTWKDGSGTEHVACWRHIKERLNRYPEAPAEAFLTEEQAVAMWDEDTRTPEEIVEQPEFGDWTEDEKAAHVEWLRSLDR